MSNSAFGNIRREPSQADILQDEIASTTPGVAAAIAKAVSR